MTAYSLRAEPIENGYGDSIGCKELRNQSFSATRLLSASEVRNGSDFSERKMVCGRNLLSKIG